MRSKSDLERRTMIDDARQELRDAAEDLFYAAKLFRAAGDVAMASDVAALAERALLDASLVGRTN